METRLIRAEKTRLGKGVIYEISHDTLVKPILESREKKKRQRKFSQWLVGIVLFLLVLFGIFYCLKEKEINQKVEEIKAKQAKIDELEAPENTLKDTAQSKVLGSIKKFEKLIHDMNPSYFEYDSTYHNHIIKLPIKFSNNSYNIPSSQLLELNTAGQLITALVDSMKNEQLHFVVIIEGQASNDKFPKNNKLSYRRALAVLEYWKEEGINIHENKYIELIIAGSGTGGIMRDEDESNNRRFLIQIIPKFELIE